MIKGMWLVERILPGEGREGARQSEWVGCCRLLYLDPWVSSRTGAAPTDLSHLEIRDQLFIPHASR